MGVTVATAAFEDCSGIVRSVAAGEADISATYSSLSGSRQVRMSAAVVTRTLRRSLAVHHLACD
jgi:hypothetical protein